MSFLFFAIFQLNIVSFDSEKNLYYQQTLVVHVMCNSKILCIFAKKLFTSWKTHTDTKKNLITLFPP